ncbi:MAG: GAF domain-containing protein [Anaerolineae bacterium]|nr:GAF domain-containing protein [Anaerolineae bacterium]
MGRSPLILQAAVTEPFIMDRLASPSVNHQLITYRLLRAIGESLEPESVAYLAVEKVVELTGWPTVAILSPNANGVMMVRAAMGSLLTDVGIHGRAYRTGDTQMADNLIGDSDEGPTYQKLYSAISIPMMRSRRRLGIFSVEKDEPFSQSDVLLAESMAEVIALALDHAGLYEQSQRRLAAQTALQEATATITTSLELPVVLNRIVEQMCRAIGATSAYICSYERATKNSTVLAEYISPSASVLEQVSDLGVTYSLSDQLSRDVGFLERGELGVIYRNDANLSESMQTHMEQFGAQTVMMIPMGIGGDTIAYAELWDSRHQRQFSEDEIALCRGIAQHAAIALENARLFQAIREEHGRFQALITAATDGIILVGTDGRVLLINPPGFAFLQLDDAPEAWVGRSVKAAIARLQQKSPQAAGIIEAETNRVAAGDTAVGEGKFDLPPRTIHWRNLPVLLDGQPMGRLIVLRDTTQEHILEKMRDDLTHTMVHDLRGPLTAISISLETLQMMEQTGNANTERHLQIIERAGSSTHKLLKLVEAILELSRLEGGHLQLNNQQIALADLISNVIDGQLPLAREKQIDITSHITDALPLLTADRQLLERVLQNLVHNALKFTPHEGHVQVMVQPDVVNPALVAVTVADSGPGIPVDMQAHLFEKFSRGMQQERGSGLGLYFCRMAVEAHHGRIWLANSSETGTTIQFTLPFCPESQLAQTVPAD